MKSHGSSVITLGGPTEDGNPFILESPHRKSLFRSWKRLSRFQKNLVYLATVIAALFLVYYTIVNSDKVDDLRSVAVITEDDLDANVLGLLTRDSKNKAKRVQDVIHDIKKSNIKDGKSPVFPVEKVVSAEDNNAKEEYGYGDEKMYDEGEVEKGNIPV